MTDRKIIPVMGLSTSFAKLFDVEHPFAMAPLGGSAGGP
jgi:nitronate monooxygenase